MAIYSTTEFEFLSRRFESSVLRQCRCSSDVTVLLCYVDLKKITELFNAHIVYLEYIFNGL